MPSTYHEVSYSRPYNMQTALATKILKVENGKIQGIKIGQEVNIE